MTKTPDYDFKPENGFSEKGYLERVSQEEQNGAKLQLSTFQ